MSYLNWVHLDNVDILKETDPAFLLRIDGEEIWVPKSQVSEPDHYCAGDEDASISITEWICRQKNIEAP